MDHGYLDGLEERISLLDDMQYKPASAQREYQFRQLKKLISHAYQHVPFYRRIMEERQFVPDDIESLSSLTKFPTIDKSVVNQHYQEFIAQCYPLQELKQRSTGGSTGNPLVVQMDQQFVCFNHANTYFATDIIGGRNYIRSGKKYIRLHGDIVDVDQTAGTYWQIEGPRLNLSSYHLSQETLGLYLQAISDFDACYLHAYPSAVYLLAHLLRESKMRGPSSLEVIFCDSEKLYEDQKSLIEEVLGAPIFQTYGHTEGAVLGIQCRHSELIHFVPQVGIVELLDHENAPVSPGNLGEITVTGFNNYAMPFIRYKTGDLARKATTECSCGRDWLLAESIEGRLQDFLIDENGGQVAVGPTIFDYNFDWSGVERFQIFQEKIGLVLFRYVTRGQLPVGWASNFEARIDKVLGERFQVQFEQVHKLDFTRIGKFRYVDQRLSLTDVSS